MTVTYQDELGFVSVQINDEYGVVFDRDFAHFDDENGKSYKVQLKYLISITKAE